MHDMRNTIHHDFKRDRDLLLNLFRRNSRPLRNHFDIVVGDVGISLNRQMTESDDAPSEKNQGEGQHEQAIAESKVNDPANHLLLHRILQNQGIRNHLIPRFESGNNCLHVAGKHASRDYFLTPEMSAA